MSLWELDKNIPYKCVFPTFQRWRRLQGSDNKGPGGPVAGGLVVEPPSVVSVWSNYHEFKVARLIRVSCPSLERSGKCIFVALTFQFWQTNGRNFILKTTSNDTKISSSEGFCLKFTSLPSSLNVNRKPVHELVTRPILPVFYLILYYSRRFILTLLFLLILQPGDPGARGARGQRGPPVSTDLVQTYTR